MTHGALIFSRARGYLPAAPGDLCVMRVLGQTIRVTVRAVVSPGRVSFYWPIDIPNRPSGWPRGRLTVRAGRLQLVDF